MRTSHDTAAAPLVVVGLAVLATFAAGFLAYTLAEPASTTATNQTTGQVNAQSIDANGDQTVEWIRLDLAGSVDEVTYNQTSIHFYTPSGREGRTVCTSPETDRGRCRYAFGPRMVWTNDRPLWIPCQAPGNHTVTVVLEAQLAFSNALYCGGRADA